MLTHSATETKPTTNTRFRSQNIPPETSSPASIEPVQSMHTRTHQEPPHSGATTPSTPPPTTCSTPHDTARRTVCRATTSALDRESSNIRQLSRGKSRRSCLMGVGACGLTCICIYNASSKAEVRGRRDGIGKCLSNGAEGPFLDFYFKVNGCPVAICTAQAVV